MVEIKILCRTNNAQYLHHFLMSPSLVQRIPEGLFSFTKCQKFP